MKLRYTAAGFDHLFVIDSSSYVVAKESNDVERFSKFLRNVARL